MAVLLAKRALPRSFSAPPAEVAEELARLPLGFGQQALSAEAVSLNLKKMGGTSGAWRLRVGDWRVIFFPSGDDFLVAAIGLRKDIYERAGRMRLARRGEGLTIIEAAAPEVAAKGTGSQATSTTRARRPTAVQQNRFSPSMTRCCEGSTASATRSSPSCAHCPRRSTLPRCWRSGSRPSTWPSSWPTYGSAPNTTSRRSPRATSRRSRPSRSRRPNCAPGSPPRPTRPSLSPRRPAHRFRSCSIAQSKSG